MSVYHNLFEYLINSTQYLLLYPSEAFGNLQIEPIKENTYHSQL